jgi:GINS complex subunit 2
MAGSEQLLMTSAQVEFLAEDVEVQIIPEFASPAITLLAGRYGPFVPAYPTAVPLWFALLLKQRQRCRIIPPAWLQQEALQATIQAERDQPLQFEALHDHYFEMATSLLRHAPEDIPNSEKVRTLLEDLWALRNTKVREQISSLLESASTLKATNMSRMEINVWRNTLTLSMDHFHSLSTPLDLSLRESQSRSLG